MTQHGRGTDRGSTTARIYCPWAEACWCGFRVTSGWCLPAVSLIYYSAFPQDLQISHWVQEPWLFPELFLTFSEECLCIDLCSLCWTNCLEGTSQFLMHGCFFRYSIFRYLDISDINFAKDIPAKVTSILDVGEEFVKNIVLSMIDHCNRLYYTWNPLNFIILFSLLLFIIFMHNTVSRNFPQWTLLSYSWCRKTGKTRSYVALL